MDSVEKDGQFYMTLVTIQVEDCLFRVPRQTLEQSRIFQHMFSLPVAEEAEGSGDGNPIRLDGIKKAEFKRFLDVLLMVACEESTKQCSNFDMWFPVLKLAHMWEFEGIHKYAVGKLPYSQVYKTPAEKVGLAFHYDIKSWLLPGLNELAKREVPLGNYDLELLGPDLLLKMAAVRESLTYRCNGIVAGKRGVPEVDFTPVIKDVFRISS